jgi:Protein of unknown function (DUF3592).
MNRPTLSRKAYTNRASFALSAVFLIFAILTGAFSAYELRTAGLLAREGVDTRGIVIDRSTSTTRRSNGTTSRSYNLVIRFTGPDGAPVEVNRSVAQSLYNSSSIGTQLPVRYARSHPTTVELSVGQTGRTGTTVGYICAGFVVALLVTLLLFWRSVSAQRRAAEDGERRMAEVTEHKRVGKPSAGRYQFLWEAGSARGRSISMKAEALPDVGAQVPVYVDPRSGRGWLESEF